MQAERVVGLLEAEGWVVDLPTLNLWLDIVARSARAGRAEVNISR
jgi:hypothetical protein